MNIRVFGLGSVFGIFSILGVAMLSAQPGLAQERTNPFLRPAGQLEADANGGVPAPELELRAVAPSDKAPLANINGEVLGVGEFYGSYELLAVRSDGVALKLGDTVVDLPLWRED